MSVIELDTLILRNLRDLDATAQRIVELNALVWKEVDRLVEQWASTHGWHGQFDVEGAGLWVTPPRWAALSEDPDDADVYFIFEEVHDLPTSYYDLASLCAIGGSHYGFRLGQNLFGRPDWTKKVREEHTLELMGQLHLRTTNKAVPFSPTRIDPNLLADALETGDFASALKPISTALDHLLNADEIIGSLFYKPASSRPKKARTSGR